MLYQFDSLSFVEDEVWKQTSLLQEVKLEGGFVHSQTNEQLVQPRC